MGLQTVLHAMLTVVDTLAAAADVLCITGPFNITQSAHIMGVMMFGSTVVCLVQLTWYFASAACMAVQGSCPGTCAYVHSIAMFIGRLLYSKAITACMQRLMNQAHHAGVAQLVHLVQLVHQGKP